MNTAKNHLSAPWTFDGKNVMSFTGEVCKISDQDDNGYINSETIKYRGELIAVAPKLIDENRKLKEQLKRAKWLAEDVNDNLNLTAEIEGA